MKLSVVPNSAEMIRDGGSFYCELKDIDRRKFIIFIQIIPEKIPGREFKLSDSERLTYTPPDRNPFLDQIYKRPRLFKDNWRTENIVETLSWKMTYRVLIKSNPMEHDIINFQGDAGYPPMIVDHMADMIEVVRRNMTREAIN